MKESGQNVFDLRIERLNKTNKQKNGAPIRAVDNLNLLIEPGQLIGFLGPNGAGKTTTIKMICSLVKPISGHVYIGQYDVWNKTQHNDQWLILLEGTCFSGTCERVAKQQGSLGQY